MAALALHGPSAMSLTSRFRVAESVANDPKRSLSQPLKDQSRFVSNLTHNVPG